MQTIYESCKNQLQAEMASENKGAGSRDMDSETMFLQCTSEGTYVSGINNPKKV